MKKPLRRSAKRRYDDYYIRCAMKGYEVYKFALCKNDLLEYWASEKVGKTATYSEALALIRMHKAVGA